MRGMIDGSLQSRPCGARARAGRRLQPAAVDRRRCRPRRSRTPRRPRHAAAVLQSPGSRSCGSATCSTWPMVAQAGSRSRSAHVAPASRRPRSGIRRTSRRGQRSSCPSPATSCRFPCRRTTMTTSSRRTTTTPWAHTATRSSRFGARPAADSGTASASCVSEPARSTIAREFAALGLLRTGPSWSAR